MIEKLDMRTPDFTDENIAQIAKIFPNCVVETKDDNGKVKPAIDFDLLKQELSANIVEGSKERYRLEWPGKKEALVIANKPINKTLRPNIEESVNFDTTQNLYIEGDNLEALKLLQESYLNKIKMIYIDPPYNTGKDFVYKDNFTNDRDRELENSGQISEDGRLVANLQSNGRFHSDWLSMMYPRLKLARNLLKDDGVIFISIDDNEVANLRKICDEIFGEDNFVEQFIWKSGRTASSIYTREHEYILAYARNIELINLLKYKGEDVITDRTIKKISIKNPACEIKFKAGVRFEGKDKIFPNKFGESEIIEITKGIFECKNGLLANDVTIKAGWAMKDMIESWFQNQEVIDSKGQILKEFYFKENGVLQYIKERGTVHPKTIITEMSTKDGTNQLNQLFGFSPFDFPKTPKLIEYFLNHLNQNDIILDFFSGSATTAHAVMQLNAEDGGNRKFIMVQIPELTDEKSEAYKAGYKNICEIGIERIRRAGKKILEENKDKEGIENLDIGFRVFKVDSSNMKDVYYNPDEISQDNLFDMVSNIKEDRSDLDLLFQVLLDSGVELTLPIEEKQIAGKKVYFVDGNVLAACFEDNLTEEFVTKLAKCDDLLKVVFRDSSFGSDDSRINVEQIFKQYSPNTQIRVI